MLTILILLAGAYLVGSIPFGKIYCHIFANVDIQKRGSGNIGFANVQRICGWPIGLATLACDIAKGFIPTYIALQLGQPTVIVFLVGISAILGHVFPMWLMFNGGKGIATGLGLIIVMSPAAAAVAGFVFIVATLLKQQASSASLEALIAAGLVVFITQPQLWWIPVILLAIALWTLRHNLAGTLPDYG